MTEDAGEEGGNQRLESLGWHSNSSAPSQDPLRPPPRLCSLGPGAPAAFPRARLGRTRSRQGPLWDPPRAALSPGQRRSLARSSARGACAPAASPSSARHQSAPGQRGGSPRRAPGPAEAPPPGAGPGPAPRARHDPEPGVRTPEGRLCPGGGRGRRAAQWEPGLPAAGLGAGGRRLPAARAASLRLLPRLVSAGGRAAPRKAVRPPGRPNTPVAPRGPRQLGWDPRERRGARRSGLAPGEQAWAWERDRGPATPLQVIGCLARGPPRRHRGHGPGRGRIQICAPRTQPVWQSGQKLGVLGPAPARPAHSGTCAPAPALQVARAGPPGGKVRRCARGRGLSWGESSSPPPGHQVKPPK